MSRYRDIRVVPTEPPKEEIFIEDEEVPSEEELLPTLETELINDFVE